MSFGKNIVYYRKKQKITQEELAERLYVSRQTISRWENDSVFPDVETIIKLCELFDCNMDTLVRGDAEAEEKEEIKIDLGGLEKDKEESDDEDEDDEEESKEHIKKWKKRSRIAEKVNEIICSVVMTIAVFSYVLYGLLQGVWHPTWVVFIIGAGICAISSIITNVIGE